MGRDYGSTTTTTNPLLIHILAKFNNKKSKEIEGTGRLNNKS